ncbi:hypothetical protein [Arthrobacter sp. ISL-95]|uniref:hypothetical protein n=1 Tax=Arthrobacter sp. ISL-95 TaxID=2819116 RepID=UPI001BE6E0EB|nr:hypothetical protein [Arthrobacter sp. ISL-95]MBT2587919.1 hypothetical protein [Arthrobacter sp. ISL-95]
MSTPAMHRSARDALLSFARTARIEGRAVEGFHWLGESPNDSAYRVKVTLSVRHDSTRKIYRVQMGISEERYEGGFASQRHEFHMPHKSLPDVAATRFNAKSAERIYGGVLQALKVDITPLAELLQEEAERQ